MSENKENDDKIAPNYFIMEKQRVESFIVWPFDENAKCSIQKMSEAGFYWNGNDREHDTAACFACDKVLDGWEESDDPWSEHMKHAPQCAFVKLGKVEKDLTVDEFLTLVGIVMKNRLTKTLNARKMKLVKECDKMKERFLKSN